MLTCWHCESLQQKKFPNCICETCLIIITSFTTSYFYLICMLVQDVRFTGISLRMQKTNISCFRCIVSLVLLHCLLGSFVLFGFCCIVSWVSLYCLLVFVEVGGGGGEGGGGRGRGGICRHVPWNYSQCDKYNDDKANGFHYLIFYHEYSMLIIFSSPRPPPLIFFLQQMWNLRL